MVTDVDSQGPCVPKTHFFSIPPQQHDQHWISDKRAQLQHGNTVQEGEVQLSIQGKHATPRVT